MKNGRCIVLLATITGALPIGDAAHAQEPALGGLDPVTLTEGTRTPGDKTIFVDHNGWRYQFATTTSLNKFKKSPERYALQDDGFCMVMGDVRARAELYCVLDGLIYGFGSRNCVADFVADSELFLLTKESREHVIQELATEIQTRYVFPEIGAELARQLREASEGGEFNSVKGAPRLAARLNTWLKERSDDRHLIILDQPQRTQSQSTLSAAERATRRAERYAKINYGFAKIQVLEGNIGHIDLRNFVDPDIAGETAANAMSVVRHCDAIIIDLRKNYGGSPNMVAFLASYFFESRPVHLNSIYWREHDRTDQLWTYAFVPGERRPSTPLYVLTSARTFSAAEEFAYDMQALGRGTIVGEQTAGGAHLATRIRLSDVLVAQIPNGRAINPVTGGNWEGSGVMPDIEVDADMALETAMRIIRKERD